MAKRFRTAEILRQTRLLNNRLGAFDRSARAVCGRLDPFIPSEEVEVMESARANILGTLENLLNQDLPDVMRQLSELEDHILTREPQIGVRGHGRAVGDSTT